MALQHTLEILLQILVDGLIASIPRKRPEPAALQNCRIVSHRGEHDNRVIMENTMDAFEAVFKEGIWGIEFDIRWTADHHPVVIHDADCKRVFDSPVEVARLTLEELQSKIPKIPSLQQVVDRFGKKMHLMIELKYVSFTEIDLKRTRLQAILSALTPARDFHLLALKIELFELFDIIPGSAMLPVAEFKLKALSQIAIERNYAGICGQYLLISNKLIQKHRQGSQKIGIGFARSRFSLYRELNREIDWIFTNHAIKLNHIRKKLLELH
jgi:glycerophosphoryl diester phosphodiesterase